VKAATKDPVIEALGARFAATKADALAALSPLAGAAPLSPAQRLEVQTISHKLAGVSAIFGEPALGDAARDLDDALSEPETGEGALAGLLRELVTLLSM
jgi:HPt (histidine-containing phosphotransfer) domain-containing protein